MKNIPKTIGLIFLITAIGALVADCVPSLPGIELGNHGGSNKSNAYPLTEGKWTYGYLPSYNTRRWFSNTVTSGDPYWIWLYGDSLFKGNVKYYFHYAENSWGPYSGNYSFTPNFTGTLFIEVYDEIGPFAVTYTNSPERPNSAKFWDE